MKMKHMSGLAAAVVASLGVASAHALQNDDTALSTVSASSQTTDPDVARQIRNQSGSPKMKADLYVAASASVADRNLVREVRYQNGSPRRKPDLYVAASAPAADRDLARGIRDQNGSPKSKK
jgi:predicted nucleic acid-binding Zn ribbon protein